MGKNITRRTITFRRQPQHEIYWQAVKKHNDNFLTNNDMADQTKTNIVSELTDAEIEQMLMDNDTPKYLKQIGERFDCEISKQTQKIDQLNYIYHYSLYFASVDDVLFISIESGIDNGSRLIDMQWDKNPANEKVEAETLIGVEFDEEAFNSWFIGDKRDRATTKRKAKAIFENNKAELLKSLKEQNYDNYATGGSANKTHKVYADKFAAYTRRGVFWKGVYEKSMVHKNVS